MLKEVEEVMEKSQDTSPSMIDAEPFVPTSLHAALRRHTASVTALSHVRLLRILSHLCDCHVPEAVWMVDL